MAEMDMVPAGVRREFVRRLLEEVREMEDDELAMLLLHGMDDSEVRARIREIETGVVIEDQSFH